MLEYGIKTITTNPTLITKSKEIIRLVDNRNHETRAFVLPVSYEPIIKKMVKEMEFQKWVANKKRVKKEDGKDSLEDIMVEGMKSIDEYMSDEK